MSKPIVPSTIGRRAGHRFLVAHLALIACWSATACGGQVVNSEHRLLVPANTKETGPSLLAALGGRMTGRVAGKDACLWVDGSQPATVIVWPKGYSAIDNPLRVLDTRNRIVATKGDVLDKIVTIGGGLGPSSSPFVNKKRLIACPKNHQVFFVGDVKRKTSTE
jgi:hypothetical protein